MPNGDYKLRVDVFKPLGTEPGDVETYTSPTFTIARPHCSGKIEINERAGASAGLFPLIV
jgi:hypothetical protein